MAAGATSPAVPRPDARRRATAGGAVRALHGTLVDRRASTDDHAPGRVHGRPVRRVRGRGRTNRRKENPDGRRHDEAAAGGRCPLRPPDPPLEPEDEAVHLRRAQRHLHHRPAARPWSGSTSPTVRARPRRRRRQRSSSSAPRSRPRSPIAALRRALRDALRQRALARRDAHQLPDHRRPRQRSCRSSSACRRPATSSAMPKKEAPRPRRGSSRSSSATSAASAASTRLPDAIFVIDTKKEHIAVTEANKLGMPDRRRRRHQLRPRRDRLRDPGQRRRHPLRHPDVPDRSPTPSTKAACSPSVPGSSPRHRRRAAPKPPPVLDPAQQQQARNAAAAAAGGGARRASPKCRRPRRVATRRVATAACASPADEPPSAARRHGGRGRRWLRSTRPTSRSSAS